MSFTNSSLISCTVLSPNKNTRVMPISRITIHHMAWKGASAKQCGDSFSKSSRQASSNYGIGNNGEIGLYVEEKNRSWCSSSYDNDQKAVTIEVANSTSAPKWEVSAKAYYSLINLVTDICKRNGKNKVIWIDDMHKALNYQLKDNEMLLTVHRWFSSTSCPGPYLYSKMGDIANKVNAKLQNTNSPVDNKATENTDKPDSVKTDENRLYRVQVGVFRVFENAQKRGNELKKQNIDTIIKKKNGYYKVQIGAFKDKENAETLLKEVQTIHKDAFMTYE